MRPTAWMRIIGGVLSTGVSFSRPQVVLASRGPPTILHGRASDIAAVAAAASRGARIKRSSSPREPVLDDTQQATGPGVGGANDAAASTSGLAAAGATAARSPRARGRNAGASSSPKAAGKSKSNSNVPDLDLNPAALAPGSSVRLQPPSPQQPPQAPTSNTTGDAAAGSASSAPANASPVKPRTRRVKAVSAAAAAAADSSSPKPAMTGSSETSAGAASRCQSDLSTGQATQLPPSPAPTPAVRCTASSGVLLIVDGNYLANRSYFGYGGRGLSTSGGVPTSVTYGVIRVLAAAIRAVQPTSLAVVFDPPGPTFRSAMSLLDPEAAAAGAAAAALVRQGLLDWQDLASRLLHLEPVRGAMQAAAAVEAAAAPVSYLHPSGSFLPPRPQPSPASASVSLLEVLAEALGEELAAALGLTTALAAGPSGASTATGTALDALVPPYKAGRLSKGDDFYTDLSNLQRLLGLMSVPPLWRPWLEADDLAGLLVQQAVQHGMAVRIVSGDRDLMQLVSDPYDVTLLYPASASSSAPSAAGAAAGGGRRRGGGGGGVSFPFNELREADVVSALGVAPAQVADYKALTGDASDRLPGVSGIGPKTAAQLLATYGSLAGVYGAAGELTPKRRACLQAALPASQYTLTLARVLGSQGAPTAPPGVLPDRLLQRLQLRGFDPGFVGPALEELEMRSLAKGVAPGGELWAAFGGHCGGGAAGS